MSPETSVHPASTRQAVVAAVVAIEDAAAHPDAFPVVPLSLPRILRLLAEDAVRAVPAGLTNDQIEVAAGFPQTKVRDLLNDIPGILAIYAPRTVALVRSRSDRKGNPYVYHLVPA
jgi:hypothetical protein